nr:hypothetical protein [Lysinibacter cavernae]
MRYQPNAQAIQSFREFAERQYPEASKAASGSIFARILVIVVIAPMLFFLFLSMLGMLVSVVSGSSSPLYFVAGLVVTLILAGACGFGIWAFVKGLRSGGVYPAWFKLFYFANENGFRFTPLTTNPFYPGMIFNIGSGRQSSNRIHSAPNQRFFDMGTMRFVTGSGKNQTTHIWGYLTFQLDRRLPHIVLDSKQNNGNLFGLEMSNLPSSFSKDQRLSLEGNFDDYFTLYCPSQYERDALYVLTPDLMALLIDHSAPFDVEIVDDLVFVYSQRGFDLSDEALTRRLFGILDTVGAKTLRQSHRYADDRVPDSSMNVVAVPGQRLRSRWWVAIVTALVIVFGLPLLGILTTMIGGLIAVLTGSGR